MIIYTAIFGPYDELKDPLHVIPGCRYICYTDQVLNSKVWELVMVKPRYDPVRQAREVKILFHKYNPYFEGKAMWIDANQQITSDITHLFSISEKSLTLLYHPDRNCIYKEAHECIKLKKEDDLIIAKHRLRYLKESYPSDNGLAATGLMIRKNDKDLNLFFDNWFDQIVIGSRRDQLSFNYVIWKFNWELDIQFDLIPFDTLKKHFTRCPHNK